MKKSFKSLAVLTLLVGASQFHQAHAAGVSGAIFTTVANGTVVNANQYASKCDVYLNGGPGPNAKAGAAGLPDGDYYFQVTDPNGKTLLSTDPVINRSFHVTGGVITAYTGITGPTHATNTDQAHAGAITISVANSSCPTDFQDSPNSGGVYKVWATPTNSYIGDPTQVDNPNCGNGCFHGFAASASKTDNFKVLPGIPNFCLTVYKQIPATYDLTGNPTSWQPFDGWDITLVDNSTGTSTTLPTGPPMTLTNGTGLDGAVQFCALPAGSYTVSETPTALVGFFDAIVTVNGVTAIVQPPLSPSITFTWSSMDSPPSVTFQNLPLTIG
jgi:hypothetical protein